jgi:hypothetical protein
MVRLGQVLDFLSFSALRVSRQELQNVIHVVVEGANELNLFVFLTSTSQDFMALARGSSACDPDPVSHPGASFQ